MSSEEGTSVYWEVSASESDSFMLTLLWSDEAVLWDISLGDSRNVCVQACKAKLSQLCDVTV